MAPGISLQSRSAAILGHVAGPTEDADVQWLVIRSVSVKVMAIDAALGGAA
jgi:hypothetical protein